MCRVLSSGAGPSGSTSPPGDKPFVGDFDGDKIETIGLLRESTGLVYFRNSHTQGVADNEFIYGDPGDRLVAAYPGPDDHYDHDGNDHNIHHGAVELSSVLPRLLHPTAAARSRLRRHSTEELHGVAARPARL